MELSKPQQETLEFMGALGFRIVEGPPPAGSALEHLMRLTEAVDAGVITEQEMRDSLRRRTIADLRAARDAGEEVLVNPGVLD